MLEFAQIATIFCLLSCVLEEDTGRAISQHMKFNEILGVAVVWVWVIYILYVPTT